MAGNDLIGKEEYEEGDSRSRKSSQDQKRTAEYLLLNYPQDIRRNLKGLTLPEEEKNKSKSYGPSILNGNGFFFRVGIVD